MRVLIVGGAGFIGSVLAPVLLARGHEVTVFDLFWFGDHLPKAVKKQKVNAGALKAEDLKPFDAVIFLAGLSNDPMADTAPFSNYVFNAALPSYLAYIARQAGVKLFIHGGSCSVYGRTEERVREDSQPQTFSPYGVSKLIAETGIIQQYCHEMRVVLFRMGTVCGPSPRMRYDLLLNAMVKDAIKKQTISVFDNMAERPILDIDSACIAYANALEDKKVVGIYNLLSFNLGVSFAADAVQKRVFAKTRTLPKIVYQGGTDIRSYSVNDGRAQRANLSFETLPTATIDKIIDGVLASTADLESSAYHNIKRFKELVATEFPVLSGTGCPA